MDEWIDQYDDLMDVDDVTVGNQVQYSVARGRWHHRGHSRERLGWWKQTAHRRHRAAVQRMKNGGRWKYRPLTSWEIW